MRRTIGIVREAYSKWERRVPLTPAQVEELVKARNVQVLVQPSPRRVFTDHQYAAAGATITDDLSGASAIFGVKQVPVPDLLADKTYMFFSHTIKAQPENMALLDACLARNVRLIDYECVRANGEATAPRLIAFGEFAGKSGMVNAFHGLGQRLLSLGYSTPFLSVAPTYTYPDYSAACAALGQVGAQIRDWGLPAEHAPFVVGIAGGGNVARGVQHAFSQLGDAVTMVEPSELAALSALHGTTGEHQHRVYGVNVPTTYMVQPPPASRPDGGYVHFDEFEYFARPEGRLRPHPRHRPPAPQARPPRQPPRSARRDSLPPPP